MQISRIRQTNTRIRQTNTIKGILPLTIYPTRTLICSAYCPRYCISYPLHITPWFHHRRSAVQSDIRRRNYVVHTPQANTQTHCRQRQMQIHCTAKSDQAIRSTIEPHRKIGFRDVDVDQPYVTGCIEHDLMERSVVGPILAVFLRLLLNRRVGMT